MRAGKDGWDYRAYLRRHARYLSETDGACEWAVDALRRRGGQLWMDTLCQSDLIQTVVNAVRAYDRHRRRGAAAYARSWQRKRPRCVAGVGLNGTKKRVKKTSCP